VFFFVLMWLREPREEQTAARPALAAQQEADVMPVGSSSAQK